MTTRDVNDLMGSSHMTGIAEASHKGDDQSMAGRLIRDPGLPGIPADGALEPTEVGLGRGQAEDAEHHPVAEEDLGAGAADDGADAQHRRAWGACSREEPTHLAGWSVSRARYGRVTRTNRGRIGQ
jgi:hypothetical protein